MLTDVLVVNDFDGAIWSVPVASSVGWSAAWGKHDEGSWVCTPAGVRAYADVDIGCYRVCGVGVHEAADGGAPGALAVPGVEGVWRCC